MEFFVSLPAYQRRYHACDHRLSKVAQFGLLPTHFSACKAIVIFSMMICKLHGYPESIISNPDTNILFLLVNFGKIVAKQKRNEVKDEHCLSPITGWTNRSSQLWSPIAF